MENGRASPSKEMVEGIARAMELGERDRWHLLITAGFSPETKTVDCFSSEYKWLRKAMTLSLKAQDPYPSVLMNQYGKILMVNKGWLSFYQEAFPDKDLT